MPSVTPVLRNGSQSTAWNIAFATSEIWNLMFDYEYWTIRKHFYVELKWSNKRWNDRRINASVLKQRGRRLKRILLQVFWPYGSKYLCTNYLRLIKPARETEWDKGHAGAVILLNTLPHCIRQRQWIAARNCKS